MNFLLEALLVGLFFLPVYWVTLFLAGALFHVVAELTGVNRAYVLTKV